MTLLVTQRRAGGKNEIHLLILCSPPVRSSLGSILWTNIADSWNFHGGFFYYSAITRIYFSKLIDFRFTRIDRVSIIITLRVGTHILSGLPSDLCILTYICSKLSESKVYSLMTVIFCNPINFLPQFHNKIDLNINKKGS